MAAKTIAQLMEEARIRAGAQNYKGHADEPLYCIEPWRNYGASTSGNSVDRDVTLNGSGSSTGSNVWYSLPSARREAIGLILLYSNQQWNHSVSVTTTKKDSNPNVPLRVATQILIYEIVCGLRDPNSFKRNSTNECGTSGDVFYNAASASVSGFSSCYNSLVSAIQSAKKIPSFCGSSSSNAPTIQLSGDTGSAYDSNGVLSAFSFSNGNGARFSKSGNTLNIIMPGISPGFFMLRIQNLNLKITSTKGNVLFYENYYKGSFPDSGSDPAPVFPGGCLRRGADQCAHYR